MKKLGRTAPSNTTGRDRYNHVFMGHPYSHRSLPVALYDRILALFAFKSEKLDVSDSEAAHLFPDAAEYREASLEFAINAAGDHTSEIELFTIWIAWLTAIFGEKVVKEQVPIRMPTGKGRAVSTKKASKTSTGKTTNAASSNTPGSDTSNTSTGSKVIYAIPDAALTTLAGDSEADDPPIVYMMTTLAKGGENKDKGKEKSKGQNKEMGNEAIRILRGIIECKVQHGNAILQGVKVLARNIEGLVRRICHLY